MPSPSPTYRPAPSTPSSTSSTPSSTGDPTRSNATRSNDTYVYGVDILAVLATGVCVFFEYNTFQPKIKKLVNDRPTAQQEQITRSTTNRTSYALDPIE